MKQDIKSYIRSCPKCQLNASSSAIFEPRPICPIPLAALPFERWGVDFVGPLPKTAFGNLFIITAIDYSTRWVVAKAVPNMDSFTV